MSTVSASTFQAERSVCDSTIEVRLSGELDLAAAPELWSCLAPVLGSCSQRVPRLVLDLSRLDFMDAAGLGVIVRVANRLRRDGGCVSIRSPRPLVRRVIDVTDAGRVLDVERDVGDSGRRPSGQLGECLR